MKPETLSALAAVISALSALVTTYWYRTIGKGFVWTKDQAVNAQVLPDGAVYIEVAIPLFNLGVGNLRFLRLRAKKIFLASNSVENFELEMDEAHFPPSVHIVTYRSTVLGGKKLAPGEIHTQLQVVDPKSLIPIADPKQLQDLVNAKLQEMGEVIFILESTYKDGSWFGLLTKRTRVAMSLRGVDLTFLSVARRRELNELFS